MTEVASEVWRRDEQAQDLRTELNLQALHSEDGEYAGLHQHLTGLVPESQQCRVKSLEPLNQPLDTN